MGMGIGIKDRNKGTWEIWLQGWLAIKGNLRL